MLKSLIGRRGAGKVTLALVAGGTAAPTLWMQSPAAAQGTVPDAGGVQLVVSATGEELPVGATSSPAAGNAAAAAGLLLHVTLRNGSPRDLSGVTLRAPVPARTRVAVSYLGQPGQNAGAVSDTAVSWSDLSVRAGAQLGPFTCRLVPAAGADGSVVFREAQVQTEASWSQPGGGRTVAPALRLNGLWGEADLRRTMLPNDLTVLTRALPESPTVALRVAVRAGSRDEDETISGGSHWLEHAYFLGTPSRPNAQVISAAIAAVGGSSNAGTSWHYTDYWKLVPADQLDLALDVLSDQLVNSTFLPEAFERERRVITEELRRRADTPDNQATVEFAHLVFQVSPLGLYRGGTAESVQDIPLSAILAHKDKLYVTGNMAMAAVGSLGHEEAVAKIERAFAGLARGPRRHRPRVVEPIQREPRRLVLGDGTRVAEVRLGWPVVGDDHPDSPVFNIIQDVLGPTGRLLEEELRTRRALVSAVSPSYSDFDDAGMFVVSARTQPAQVEQVVGLIVDEVRRLRAGRVTDEDVQDSIRAIAGRRALGNELNQSQTTIAIGEVVGTLDSFEEFLARLRTVKASDVQRVAMTYLDPANHTLVVMRT